MKNKKVLYSTKWIAYTALLTAMVIATGFIQPIPTPSGRIYWVDGIVLIAAFLMDPLSAFIAGGVGTLIYDILQSPSMMLTSLLTHGLQAALVSTLLHFVFNRVFKGKWEFIGALISALAGAVIVILGYFIHRCIFYGVPTAVTSIPRNLIQEAIGISIAITICYATTFKHQLAKNHLLPDFKEEMLGDKKQLAEEEQREEENKDTAKAQSDDDKNLTV